MPSSILRRSLPLLTASVILTSAACTTAPIGGVSTPEISGGAKSGHELVLKNLLAAELEGVEDTEVIVSHVTIPPHTSLPKHWHPGEEFGYVLEGSVTLWQKGKRNIVAKEGEVIKVPLKQVHTAITGDEGAKLVVFRVHETGQPQRVLVN